MIPLPLAAGALVLTFAAGAATSWTASSSYHGAAAAKKIGEAAAAYEARTQDLNDKSAELEGIRNGQRIVNKIIEKRVETYIDRPVYIRECLDDSGLRDFNATISGAADPGQPGSGVPAADAARGKDRRPRPAQAD
jgi:hypothetical protein